VPEFSASSSREQKASGKFKEVQIIRVCWQNQGNAKVLKA